MHLSRTIVAGDASPALVLLAAGPSYAHECTNADKPAGAGVQVIIGPDDSIEWATPGIWSRISRGLIDPDTGEGFSGLIGFDFEGDGTADLFTYIVGPGGELPDAAQWNGATCHGVINMETWFTQCIG
jgi:hypothetical protein